MREKLPVFQAFADNKEIEFQVKGRKNWQSLGNCSLNVEFDQNQYNFRVKPEPKLVPFTFEDHKLFRDKWIRYKGCFPLSRVTCYGPKGFTFSADGEWESYEDCLKKYEFEDGTPFGKYINE